MIEKPQAYAIKHGDHFCRFGSYREVTHVDSPLKATLYARASDAYKRLENPIHWTPEGETPSTQMRVVKVTVHDWTEVDAD